jgi:YaiO family outer membrane protein
LNLKGIISKMSKKCFLLFFAIMICLVQTGYSPQVCLAQNASPSKDNSLEQVGAFLIELNAERLADKLKSEGFDVEIREGKTENNETIYRVFAKKSTEPSSKVSAAQVIEQATFPEEKPVTKEQGVAEVVVVEKAEPVSQESIPVEESRQVATLRNFHTEADAEAFAHQLRDEGYNVTVNEPRTADAPYTVFAKRPKKVTGVPEPSPKEIQEPVEVAPIAAAEGIKTAEAAAVSGEERPITKEIPSGETQKPVTAIADGDVAFDKGDYETAAKYYRAEVEAHPESYEAKFKLARALSFSDHRDEAIQLYTELLATRPNNSDLLLARGRTYAWENRWQEAEADITAVTTRLPDYGDAWSALGDMYLWSDRLDKAVYAYGKWIAVDPDNPRAYIARARAYRSAGDLAAARVDFEAARTHGAPDSEIDRYLTSLLLRRHAPEATAPEMYKWEATLSYDFSSFSEDRSDWTYYTATIRHYWERASLAFEYQRCRRFDSNDYALALDAYVDLWRRAYANLRYQYSPNADLYPDHLYRIEIFQGVGKGWELSGSYDHMDFTNSTVDMYSAGIGKYIGNWYLRWRTLFIPASAKLGISNIALARYYYAGNGDDYFEINGGFSEGGEFIKGTTIIETTRGHWFGAVFEDYFYPHWGIKISASYDDEKTLVEQSIIEKSIGVKILMRW